MVAVLVGKRVAVGGSGLGVRVPRTFTKKVGRAIQIESPSEMTTIVRSKPMPIEGSSFVIFGVLLESFFGLFIVLCQNKEVSQYHTIKRNF